MTPISTFQTHGKTQTIGCANSFIKCMLSVKKIAIKVAPKPKHFYFLWKNIAIVPQLHENIGFMLRLAEAILFAIDADKRNYALLQMLLACYNTLNQ